MKLTETLIACGEKFTHPVSLVNLNLPDQPLIYTNTAFQNLTGYSFIHIEGRNCRFLQGELSDKAAIGRIRSALTDRKSICQDLLNYTAKGEIFYNRLVLIPFKEANQNFVVGLQHEISLEQMKSEHDIDQNILFDKTINPLSIMMGLFHRPQPDFEANFADAAERLRKFVVSL